MVGTDQLRAHQKEWQDELDAMNTAMLEGGPKSLKDRLAELMFTKENASQMAKQLAHLGLGKVSIGEFRNHIRSFGVRSKDIDNDEIDGLFRLWDKDGGGTLDGEEIKAALKALRAEWLEKRGRAATAELRRQQRLVALAKRVRAADVAIEAAGAVERAAAELQALTVEIASRMDIQLGGLLARRMIKATELIGSWQGVRPLPRPPLSDVEQSAPGDRDGAAEAAEGDDRESVSEEAMLQSLREGVGGRAGGPGRRAGGSRERGAVHDLHMAELTKAEWLKGVQSLGLLVGTAQGPPTAASITALFDQIDDDHNGFLDLREATAALKTWKDAGRAKYEEKAAKAKEYAELRVRASKRLQEAMREPEPFRPPPELAEYTSESRRGAAGGHEPGGAVAIRQQAQAAMRARGLERARREKQLAANATRSRALAERSKEQAQRAARILMNSQLARAWGSWCAHHLETLRMIELLGRTLGALQQHGVARTFRTWADAAYDRARQLDLMATSVAHVRHAEAARAWHAWCSWIDERARTEERRQRVAAALGQWQRPQLVHAFHSWRSDAAPSLALLASFSDVAAAEDSSPPDRLARSVTLAHEEVGFSMANTADGAIRVKVEERSSGCSIL